MKSKNNILVGLLFFIFGLTMSTAVFSDKQGASSQLKVPFKFAVGKKKYQENCSSCHGMKLEGSKQGPPLIHGFYKPSHHGDPAFYRAALKGVRAHHWKFGNMPKIAGITRRDMDRVIPFIRWFQQAKGLY